MFEQIDQINCSGDHAKVAVAQDGIFSLPLRQLLYQDEEEQVEINHITENKSQICPIKSI